MQDKEKENIPLLGHILRESDFVSFPAIQVAPLFQWMLNLNAECQLRIKKTEVDMPLKE